MERHKERLSPEAVLLDKYLNSYNRCKNRKRAAGGGESMTWRRNFIARCIHPL